MKFSGKKFWELAILKISVFWVGHFEFFFFKKKKCFIPIKISPILCGRMDWLKFWCFPWFPESSLLCVILRYTVYTHAFVSIIDLTINDAKSDRDALVIQAALPMTMTTIKVYRRCQEFAPLRPSWNFRPRRLYCEASERRQIGGISYDSSAFYTTKPISCKNKAVWPFLSLNMATCKSYDSYFQVARLWGFFK